MDDNARQAVLGAGVVGNRVAVDDLALEFGEAEDGVGLHVKVARKLEVVVELDGTDALEVILKTFQLYAENRRQLFDTQPFHGHHFLFAFFTVVRVGTFQKLSCKAIS